MAAHVAVRTLRAYRDHEVFQMLFGMVMTLLIAMEFKHPIIRVAIRRESIVQVKTVVLISLSDDRLAAAERGDSGSE